MHLFYFISKVVNFLRPKSLKMSLDSSLLFTNIMALYSILDRKTHSPITLKALLHVL